MSSNYTFKNNDLELKLQENLENISLTWSGESTEREPGIFLTPILDQVITLNEKTDKKIIMDFRQLQYMNSSTVTPIIRLIDKIKKGNHEMLILYQNHLDWQEICFSALLVFTTKDHRIDIKGD